MFSLCAHTIHSCSGCYNAVCFFLHSSEVICLLVFRKHLKDRLSLTLYPVSGRGKVGTELCPTSVPCRLLNTYIFHRCVPYAWASEWNVSSAFHSEVRFPFKCTRREWREQSKTQSKIIWCTLHGISQSLCCSNFMVPNTRRKQRRYGEPRTGRTLESNKSYSSAINFLFPWSQENIQNDGLKNMNTSCRRVLTNVKALDRDL